MWGGSRIPELAHTRIGSGKPAANTFLFAEDSEPSGLSRSDSPLDTQLKLTQSLGVALGTLSECMGGAIAHHDVVCSAVVEQIRIGTNGDARHHRWHERRASDNSDAIICRAVIICTSFSQFLKQKGYSGNTEMHVSSRFPAI